MNIFEKRFVEKRKVMVSTQIKSRGIKDLKVLEVMNKVPRHEFVPGREKARAYEDYPLSIGEGQTISQPYIVALMTECLELKGGEKVLEIGTGSGYQAAVLAEIAGEVYSIEIVEKLAKKAEETLNRLGYENIKVKHGDGYLGWKDYAPYDGIIVTCAPEKVPQPLIDQLAEGGKLVIPVGGVFEVQTLKVLEKKEGKIHTRRITGVRFVPMTGPASRKE